MSKGWTALVLVAVATSGCRQDRPDDAYRAFAKAFAERNADTAWKLLSSSTRALLTSTAKATALAEHAKAPKDGRGLMFEGESLARKVKAVAIIREGDERATVEVLDDAGGRAKVAMVRERGKWRVDLTKELRAVAARIGKPALR